MNKNLAGQKPMKRILAVALLGATASAGLLSPAVADDTELFRYPPTSSTVNTPNVLIMLDTSANWSTRYVTEKSALMSLQTYFSSSVQRSNVNVGLMNGAAGREDGGYMRSAIRSMSNVHNRGAFFGTLNSLDNSSGEKSNAPAPSNMFAEAFYYLTGKPVSTGTADASDYRDYPGNNSTGSGGSTSLAPWKAYWRAAEVVSRPADSTYALTSASASTYNAPASIYAACSRNYIIYISNGANSGGTDDASGCTKLANAASASGLTGAKLAAATEEIPISPNTYQENCTDEWARFMKNYYDFGTSTEATGFQGVTTYAIEIEPKSNGSGPANSAMWRSVASVGGGEYIRITDATSSTQLEVALTRIFNQIQSQTSVFASAALPVSVNQRSTNLNQVYIGLFNTDPNDNARWPGNLKQYQLGYDNSTRELFLADKTGVAAIDSTGQFKSDVSSHWTTPSSYWSFKPDIFFGVSDGPDGGSAERGGAGQLQRMTPGSKTLKTEANRKVYTYTGTSENPNVSLSGDCIVCKFNELNLGISYEKLGVGLLGRGNLIEWIRGANNYAAGTEYGVGAFGFTDASQSTLSAPVTVDTSKIRPSVQGDVLHSRPAVVNYNRGGTNDTPDPNDVVVFYGSNDGTLRALQGGQAATLGTPSYTPGTEKWAFIAPESFGKLNALRLNNVPASLPGFTGTFTTSGTGTTLGTNTLRNLSAEDYAKVRDNQRVSGANIPAGAYVVGKVNCPVTTATNCVDISVNPTTTTTSAAVTFKSISRPYFWDGSLSTWVKDANDDGRITTGTSGDKALLFATQRRGGRMLYAFDVTNPEAPTFLWKRGCPNVDNNEGCSTGFTEMGQTWSAVTPAKLAAADNTLNLGVVVGAGYDANYEDNDPRTGSAKVGRGVFVLDALTGNIIRKFVSASSSSASDSNTTAVTGMDYSVASDVSVLARDRLTNVGQNAYRAYFGDTGANVWRIDLSDADPANWVINKLASFNAAGRKFLFAPDIVFGGKDSRGNFDYILMGSGDREHPFQGLTNQNGYPNSATVEDWFFMVKDYNYASYNSTNTPNSSHLGKSITDLYDASADLVEIGTTSEVGIANAALDSAYGWRIRLNGYDASMTANDGEKTVGGATTVAGVVYFTTNRPTGSNNACGVNLGEAKLYAVEIKNAGAVENYFTSASGPVARYSVIPGGGFPPTPVPVSIVIDGRRVEGVISGTKARSSATQVGTRVRTYVRRLQDKKN